MRVSLDKVNYTIPYSCINEYADKSIGVFGDSFAGIAEQGGGYQGGYEGMGGFEGYR